MESLSWEEKEQLNEVLTSYERGAETLDEVRGRVFSVLGGGHRIVSGSRGIWVRTEEGKKLKAIARDTKLKNCRIIAEDDLEELAGAADHADPFPRCEVRQRTQHEAALVHVDGSDERRGFDLEAGHRVLHGHALLLSRSTAWRQWDT